VAFQQEEWLFSMRNDDHRPGIETGLLGSELEARSLAFERRHGVHHEGAQSDEWGQGKWLCEEVGDLELADDVDGLQDQPCDDSNLHYSFNCV